MGPMRSNGAVLADHSRSCGHCWAWLNKRLQARGWEMVGTDGWAFKGPRNAFSANWFAFWASMKVARCPSLR